MTELNTHYRFIIVNFWTNDSIRQNYRKIKRELKDISSSIIWEVQTSKGWEIFDEVAKQQLELCYKKSFPFVNIKWYDVSASVHFTEVSNHYRKLHSLTSKNSHSIQNFNYLANAFEDYRWKIPS